MAAQNALKKTTEGPNTPFKKAQKEIWGTDVFDAGIMEKPANDNKQAYNPYLTKKQQEKLTKKAANDNNKLPPQYIQGKFTDNKAPQFYEHTETGDTNFIPENVKRELDPSLKYSTPKAGNDNPETFDAYTQESLTRQRQSVAEDAYLQAAIEQDEFERALAFEQAHLLEKEKQRRSLKVRLINKYTKDMQAAFKLQGVSINKNEARKLLEKGMKVSFPFIMITLAIVKDLLDVFVALISLGLTALFGLGLGIDLVYKPFTALYLFIFFWWSKRYGADGKAKKLDGIKWKLFKRYVKKRGWTMILEFIPFIEALPMNTYNVYYVYRSWKNMVFKSQKVYRDFTTEFERLAKKL